MIAKQVRIEIQKLLGVTPDGEFGEAETFPALKRLADTKDGVEWSAKVPEPIVPEDVTSRVDERGTIDDEI